MSSVREVADQLPPVAADVGQYEGLAGALSRCETCLEPPVLDRILVSLTAGLRSAHASVCSAALLVLPALFPLLTVTTDAQGATPSQLKHALVALTAPGLLFERAGDSRDRVRDGASHALAALGQAAVAADASESVPKDIETPLVVLDRLIRDSGLASKAPRVRETVVRYIARLRSDAPHLPLRPYVAPLVTALEDSDPHVREAAREATITVFSNPAVGSAARADLKVQLARGQVRKTTVDIILSRVLRRQEVLSEPGGGPRSDGTEPVKPRPSLGLGAPAADPQSRSVSNSTAVSTGSMSDVAPVHVASVRDLENDVAKMQPAFEGKETEQNWQAREANVTKLRGMLGGDVHRTYQGAFLGAVRGLLEGLMRALASLRTTLMSCTCHLFEDLATSLRSAFDPFVDTVLPALLKMGAQTKRMAVTASQAAARAIIANCSYRDKMLSALSAIMNDKASQARQQAIGQLHLFVQVHALQSRQAIESGNGLDLLEQSIQKALTDATPAVRESARPTFWVAHAVWPQQFDRLKAGLDANGRMQLDRAGGQSGSGTTTTTPTAATSPNKPRTSVRQIISQRRSEGNLRASRPSEASRPPLPTHPSVTASSMPPPPVPSHARSPERSPPRQSVSGAPLPPSPTRLPIAIARESHRAVSMAARIPLPGDDLAHSNSPSFAARRSTLSNGHNGIHHVSQGAPAPGGRRRTSSSEGARSDRQHLPPGIDGVVEDAMRMYAEHAEEAAARLLQLDIDGHEDVAHASALTPGSPRTTVVPKPSRDRLTPVRSPVAAIFADSPARRSSPSSQLKRQQMWPSDSYWTLPKRINPPLALPDDPTARRQSIEGLMVRLESATATAEDVRQLMSSTTDDTYWAEGKRFDRLCQVLEQTLCGRTRRLELSVPAFLLLHYVFANLGRLLAGREVAIYQLLLESVRDAAQQLRDPLDALSGQFGMLVEPLYGLRCLRTALDGILSDDMISPDQERGVLVLGIRTMGLLFRRLPPEVLDEEVPLCGSLLLRALYSADPHARMAANGTLNLVTVIFGDDTVLSTLLPPLSEDKQRLLTYYYGISKDERPQIVL